MYTQCPECLARFRVGADELRAAARHGALWPLRQRIRRARVAERYASTRARASAERPADRGPWRSGSARCRRRRRVPLHGRRPREGVHRRAGLAEAVRPGRGRRAGGPGQRCSTTRRPSWWTRANRSRTLRSKANASTSRCRQGSTMTSSSRPTSSASRTSSAWSRATSSRIEHRARHERDIEHARDSTDEFEILDVPESAGDGDRAQASITC